MDNPSIDSVFGIHNIFDRFWFEGKPINHEAKNLLRTQDLTPIYREAGFYTFRREAFLAESSRITERNKTYTVSDSYECVDIDTQFDFDFANNLYTQRLHNTQPLV